MSPAADDFSIAPIREALPIGAALLLPAFGLRALVVARFDPTVATTLVQYTPPTGLVLDFFVQWAPLLTTMGAFVLLYALGRRWTSLEGRKRSTLVVSSVLGAMFLMIPWVMESEAFPAFLGLGSALIIGWQSFLAGARADDSTTPSPAILRVCIALGYCSGADASVGRGHRQGLAAEGDGIHGLPLKRRWSASRRFTPCFAAVEM